VRQPHSVVGSDASVALAIFKPLLHCECNNTEMVSASLSPDHNTFRLVHRIQALMPWLSKEKRKWLPAALR